MSALNESFGQNVLDFRPGLKICVLKLYPVLFIPIIRVCPCAEYHSIDRCNCRKKAETSWIDGRKKADTSRIDGPLKWLFLFSGSPVLGKPMLTRGSCANCGESGNNDIPISWRNKLCGKGPHYLGKPPVDSNQGGIILGTITTSRDIYD